MTIITLPPDTKREFGATHKATFDYNDVLALGGGTTGNFQLAPKTGNLPVGTIISVVGCRVITAFDASDAAINSLALTVGDAGSNARYLASQELSTDGTIVLYKAGVAGSFVITSAGPVNAYFTVAGGGTPTLAEINAGKAEVYLSIRDFTALSRPV